MYVQYLLQFYFHEYVNRPIYVLVIIYETFYTVKELMNNVKYLNNIF